MKKSTLLLALALTAGFVSIPAAAQYLGSNDFSADNIGGLGQYSFTTNPGTLTVANGRLEYSASLADTTRALVMNASTNSAYTENWTASLTVNSLAVPTNGYTWIGLQVYAANADYGFFGIGAYRSSSGQQGILFEKAYYDTGIPDYTFVSYIAPETDFSNVLLRMSNDATTKDVTLGYSLDGGTTYQDATFFNPNQTYSSGTYASNMSAGAWTGEPTNGYSFRILGRYSGTDVLDGTTLFADDFSVVSGSTAISAVPEPSTYAAFAGLGALGLAVWRRRTRLVATKA